MKMREAGSLSSQGSEAGRGDSCECEGNVCPGPGGQTRLLYWCQGEATEGECPGGGSRRVRH